MLVFGTSETTDFAATHDTLSRRETVGEFAVRPLPAEEVAQQDGRT
jgi:hypothetical protein